MNIDPAITSDILFTLSRRDDVLLNGGDVDCASLDITEGLYRADDTALGACLSWLVAVAESEDPAKLNVETFYQVAETFVRSQRQVMELVRKVPLARPQVQKEIFKRLDTARDYVHSQFASSIAIEELAMVAGMSPFYFMRSFKKVFGVSAYQYLLNYRLQLAAQLVREHQLRLMDIAVATGFADEFALSKAFKKRFGHSPRSISFQHLQ
jgi:AraC-like DNA-binding protein